MCSSDLLHGNLAGLPNFGIDLNGDGVLTDSVGNVEFGAGHVTLDVGTSDLAGVTTDDATALLSHGVNEIRLELGDQDSFNSLFDSNHALNSALSNQLAALHGDDPTHQTLTTSIDVGNGGAVYLDAAQAQSLITDGLSFATADQVTLDVGTGTHLGNSLKELQKLGIDAVEIGRAHV